MSTFIDLDSIHRDRSNYPNPSEYMVTPDQLNGFFRTARTTRSTAVNPNHSIQEFSTSLRLVALTVPYSVALAAIPRLYVDLHSQSYNDRYLISSINGNNSDARFIAVFNRVQNDDGGNPVWIHFQPIVEQVTRFKRDDTIFFRVFTRDGNTLPNTDTLLPNAPDPNQQIIATFEITPYSRDGSYDNQLYA